jgi:hypothetical protein
MVQQSSASPTAATSEFVCCHGAKDLMSDLRCGGPGAGPLDAAACKNLADIQQ